MAISVSSAVCMAENFFTILYRYAEPTILGSLFLSLQSIPQSIPLLQARKAFLVAATLRPICTQQYAYDNGKEGLFSCPDSPSSLSSTPAPPWPWRYSSPTFLPSRRSSCASPSASCRSPSTARCTARYDKSVNIYFILYKFTL